MHGAKANTSVPCTSDVEVLEGLLQVIPGHEFAFGRFTALADRKKGVMDEEIAGLIEQGLAQHQVVGD